VQAQVSGYRRILIRFTLLCGCGLLPFGGFWH